MKAQASMPKFKVGDKVQCVSFKTEGTAKYVRQGDVGVIINVDPETDCRFMPGISYLAKWEDPVDKSGDLPWWVDEEDIVLAPTH